MALREVAYMRWAKGTPRRSYPLGGSGVPAPEPCVFDPNDVRLTLAEFDQYGLPSLIEAIARRECVAPDQVLPLPGTSQANFMVLACVLSRGDRILVEHPVYEPLCRVADLLELDVTPAQRNPTNRFQFDLHAIEEAFSTGARAILLSDLHNPSGLRLPPEALERIVALAEGYGAYVIVDEVYLDYASMHLGRRLPSAARLGDHVIVTNSLTKVYGLGSLRAGWILAAPDIIDRARNLMDHLCVINPLPAQQIAVAALAHIDALADRTRQLQEASFPVFRRWLDTRDDVTCPDGDGALFAFPRIEEVEDTRALCDLLAEEYDTTIVPGSFFQAPGHVRIGLAIPATVLEAGLTRVGEAIDRIRGKGSA